VKSKNILNDLHRCPGISGCQHTKHVAVRLLAMLTHW